MNRLRHLRERHNLSQKELAKELGISQNAISCWENGIRQPKKETIDKIADYFGVTVSYLYTDEVIELSDSEKALISSFRELDERGKGAVLVAIEYNKKFKYT